MAQSKGRKPKKKKKLNHSQKVCKERGNARRRENSSYASNKAARDEFDRAMFASLPMQMSTLLKGK